MFGGLVFVPGFQGGVFCFIEFGSFALASYLYIELKKPAMAKKFLTIYQISEAGRGSCLMNGRKWRRAENLEKSIACIMTKVFPTAGSLFLPFSH